jgi:hypothetical protein
MGKRLIHFTNIGATMQSCKRSKNEVTAGANMQLSLRTLRSRIKLPYVWCGPSKPCLTDWATTPVRSTIQGREQTTHSFLFLSISLFLNPGLLLHMACQGTGHWSKNICQVTPWRETKKILRAFNCCVHNPREGSRPLTHSCSCL